MVLSVLTTFCTVLLLFFLLVHCRRTNRHRRRSRRLSPRHYHDSGNGFQLLKRQQKRLFADDHSEEDEQFGFLDKSFSKVEEGHGAMGPTSVKPYKDLPDTSSEEEGDMLLAK